MCFEVDPKLEKKISKYLSYVLRHHPEAIGLTLDDQGWAHTADLLEKVNAQTDFGLSMALLRLVVSNNDKQRFILSGDSTRIRANQGHSIQVDLALAPIEPPAYLYHGTATDHLPSIRQRGLLKGQRHHVHLSPDQKTAKAVGGRHGKPVVLRIRTRDMHEEGFLFYLSKNGVWLVDSVPVRFIEF